MRERKRSCVRVCDAQAHRSTRTPLLHNKCKATTTNKYVRAPTPVQLPIQARCTMSTLGKRGRSGSAMDDDDEEGDPRNSAAAAPDRGAKRAHTVGEAVRSEVEVLREALVVAQAEVVHLRHAHTQVQTENALLRQGFAHGAVRVEAAERERDAALAAMRRLLQQVQGPCLYRADREAGAEEDAMRYEEAAASASAGGAGATGTGAGTGTGASARLLFPSWTR